MKQIQRYSFGDLKPDRDSAGEFVRYSDVQSLADSAKSIAEMNTILRKILARVPARVAIKAKEDAGFAQSVTVQFSDAKIDEAWLEFIRS